MFHEASGKVVNTVPPNDWSYFDWSYFEMLNAVVQKEPATSLDPELMGPIGHHRHYQGQGLRTG